jgi:hypothetical protein
MTIDTQSHRAFLGRIGVLGASTVLLPRCAPAPGGAGARSSETSLGVLVDLLRPVLRDLSRDTLNGFVAFSLPGQDRYSRAQGTPRSEPGGIETGGTDFFIENLDRSLPFPDEILRPATTALVTALRDLPLSGSVLHLFRGALGPPIVPLDLIDDAMFFLLQHDHTMPISLPLAFLLNHVATVVNPLSLSGAFLSPFARLSFADKVDALEVLETSQSNLVALVNEQVPRPLRPSVTALLKFLGGALYEFAAFGSVGERRLFDPRTRTLTASRSAGSAAAFRRPTRPATDGPA